MSAPADWVGREARAMDAMDPWPAAALIATLELGRGKPVAGDALPPFWHWLYFNDAAPRSALGLDGHPEKGHGLTPPVGEPRRMWAGGRLHCPGALPLGSPAERVSRVAAVTPKEGRAGAMTFVTLRHEITGGHGLAVVEEQDIVYRHDPPPDAPRRAAVMARNDETERRDWSCDETVLFRYSALTFNGHRIHYDLRHATETEGYPGLVVHGPLLATLLLELAAPLLPRLQEFSFRATAPIICNEDFSACAAPSDAGFDLWIRGADGRLAMTAEAR